ncbi:MAG: hypothetical protein GY756_05615 [bacterium]|nr:hypothetical protein [bacterium]
MKKEIAEMQFKEGQKALITTDEFFFAPDGKQYRSVFGTVKSIQTTEETLGVETNHRSTNWYLAIGNMIIAGCQIHYGFITDTFYDGTVKAWEMFEGKISKYDRPPMIYNCDN